MIYLDTSALAKLLVAEGESADPIEWLNARIDEPLATSIVGHIELSRAANRLGDAAAAAARRLSSGIDTLVLNEAIAASAATLAPPALRTLDATHLASAYIHRSAVSVLCAYGDRLLAAAVSLKLPVASPGRP